MSETTSSSPAPDTPPETSSNSDTGPDIQGAFHQEGAEKATPPEVPTAPPQHDDDDLPPAYQTNPPSPIPREAIKDYRGEFPPNRNMHDCFEEDWVSRAQSDFIVIGKNSPPGVAKTFAERVWIYPDYDLTIFHPCGEGEVQDAGLNGRVLANLKRHLRWRNHEQPCDDTGDELLARHKTTLALEKVIRVDTSRAYYHEDDDVYDELESSEAWRRLGEVEQ